MTSDLYRPWQIGPKPSCRRLVRYRRVWVRLSHCIARCSAPSLVVRSDPGAPGPLVRHDAVGQQFDLAAAVLDGFNIHRRPTARLSTWQA
jgi:hypothetical protein